MSASAEAGIVVPERVEPRGFVSKALRFAREHPYIVGLILAFTVAGAAFGAVTPMGELSLLRRILGGAVAGFYFGLFPLGFRLFE